MMATNKCWHAYGLPVCVYLILYMRTTLQFKCTLNEGYSAG